MSGNGSQRSLPDDETVWFAMRVTYRREMKAKRLLDEAGIENFVPLRFAVRYRYGRKVWLLLVQVSIFYFP